MTPRPEEIDTIPQRKLAEQYSQQLGGIALLLSNALSVLEVTEAILSGQPVSYEQVQRLHVGFDSLTLKYPGENN